MFSQPAISIVMLMMMKQPQNPGGGDASFLASLRLKDQIIVVVDATK
jgi:hypothetical protein